MTDSSCRFPRARRSQWLLLHIVFSLCGATTAFAQSGNAGSISLAAGIDFPSVYVFRGIVREEDPGMTVTPYGTLTVALRGNRAGPGSGESALGDIALTVGLWNSLNTGSSGLNGFTEHLHFEEDFSGGVSVGLGGRFTLAATYTAYTSPNFQFETVKEINVKVARGGWLRPYATLATDIGDGTFDSGQRAGTYLELGARPAFRLGRSVSLTVPVTMGASVKDYYEVDGSDSPFGYLDVGSIVAVPIGGASGRFGTWELHGGVDFYRFGEFGKLRNQGNANRVVASAGLGLRY